MNYTRSEYKLRMAREERRRYSPMTYRKRLSGWGLKALVHRRKINRRRDGGPPVLAIGLSGKPSNMLRFFNTPAV